jgi:cytochrome c1
MTRETLGAGIRPMSEASLTEFVSNAQELKPGVSMPPAELSDEELNAVVAYLMSLR